MRKLTKDFLKSQYHYLGYEAKIVKEMMFNTRIMLKNYELDDSYRHSLEEKHNKMAESLNYIFSERALISMRLIDKPFKVDKL